MIPVSLTLQPWGTKEAALAHPTHADVPAAFRPFIGEVEASARDRSMKMLLTILWLMAAMRWRVAGS